MSTIVQPSKNEVADITATLNTAVRDFVSLPDDIGAVLKQAQRQEIIDGAHALLDAVETHHDMWRDKSMNTALYSASQLFYEWKAFENIPTSGSITYQALAVATDTEEALLRRVGAVLVSKGLLKQIGPDDLAQSYGYMEESGASHSLNMAWHQGFVPLSRYPEYFEKYGRKEPQTLNHIPVTFAAGKPELGYFDLLAQDPARLDRFMKSMASASASIPIAGIYDLSWLVKAVEDSPTSQRPLLVDVGGGMGHAIKALHGEYPILPIGRLVLQDTPETLAAGEALKDPALAGIQRIPMNFHEEPPVSDAHAYWMRWCMHDYPDGICEGILRLVASAMAEDSKLLIQEHILDNPPLGLHAQSDYHVLAVGGKERNIDMWHRLVNAAGLRISSVSRPKDPAFAGYPCCVIECVKG